MEASEITALLTRKGELEKLLDGFEVWLLIFGVLVVIGVAGESIFGLRTWWNNRKLHDVNNAIDQYRQAETARMNRDASDARNDAAHAIERAAKAEENLAGALAGAESAKAMAKGYESQIAASDARVKGAEAQAAEANRIAEAERLARVKIEERLSGWKLDIEGRNRLTTKLKLFSGTSFDLWVNPDESPFMDVIDGVLQSAGWKQEKPKQASDTQVSILLSNKAAILYASGITIEVAEEKREAFGKAAEALINGLIAEGIPARGNLARGASANAIHVVIGKRD